MTEESSPATTEQEAEPTPAAEDNTSIQRLTLAVLGLCAFMLTWYLIADRYTPYTSQARVTGNIIPIVPRVSGEVVAVNVGVNTRVTKDDVLLQIDPADYKLAVEQSEAALEQAGQDVGAGVENLAVAEAELSQAITQQGYVNAEAKRVLELEKRGVMSVSDGDKARAEVLKSAADVESARSKLQRAQQKLGDQGADNPKLRNALATLQDARLDLERATIRAPSNGGVTSVSIASGNYATAGQAIMTFVSSETVWIEAYMRENSLGNVKPGDPVDIVLDMAPGRVFSGEVVSQGFAVDWQNAANTGSLQSVSSQKGWLRDSQRFPVIIRFDDTSSARGLLRAGGQADVMVYTSGNWITNSLAWLWMRFISIMSFAY
ncbi:MAG: HlyD family secretion protein [Halieaceae bacterium]